jgi:predicted dehydrogenase
VAKALRLAAVGTGGIWRWGHSQPLSEHPEVEIAALCDIIPEKALKLAPDYRLEPDRVYKDYRDAVTLKDIDLVDICTPNLFHSEIAIAALRAGKHVFCEKPDAVSPRKAQAMAAAAKASGKTLMVMRNNRFRPEAQWVKRLADEGQLGDLYAGRCGWIRRRGIPGKGGWFTTKELSGGGPLIDLGVHMIDLAVYLMGNPRAAAVSGATYCKFADTQVADSVHAAFGEKQAEGVFDVEDLAMGLVRFDNGATLQVECSWASNIKEESHFVELRGSKGGCRLASDAEPAVYTEMAGTAVDVIPRLGKSQWGGHGDNLYHFIDVVRKRAEPIYTPDQGVNMIRILDALYRSAASGKEVRL